MYEAIFFSWWDPSFPVKAQLQLAASRGFLLSQRTGVDFVIGQDWKKLRIFFLLLFQSCLNLFRARPFRTFPENL
jgi:hypothetical protein